MNNKDSIKSWEQVPLEVIESFGDEGDFSRQKLLNPAIFGLLGTIKVSTFWMPDRARVI